MYDYIYLYIYIHIHISIYIYKYTYLYIGAISVACGEAHCLCVVDSGELYSWGQNSCGQLGSGPSKAGFLKDEV
jgi:alpha-tubulin suppressor-like RCC1 family protein